MTDVLNITVEIHRKEAKNHGTFTKPYITNLVLHEGDDVRFSVMNVEADKEAEAEQDALAAQGIADEEAEAKARAEYEHDQDEKSRHMEDEGHPEHEEAEG